jgi:hypothetical protein
MLGLKLPPGPPGDFLIGNLRDIPSHHEWETFAKWQKEYGNCPWCICTLMHLKFLSGDLVYLNFLGTSLLYVNSAEMAHELFDKKSAIYSDRPIVPMLEL